MDLQYLLQHTKGSSDMHRNSACPCRHILLRPCAPVHVQSCWCCMHAFCFTVEQLLTNSYSWTASMSLSLSLARNKKKAAGKGRVDLLTCRVGRQMRALGSLEQARALSPKKDRAVICMRCESHGSAEHRQSADAHARPSGASLFHVARTASGRAACNSTP